jgi:hypothetical protein
LSFTKTDISKPTKKQHYCELGPKTDFLDLLCKRGLAFTGDDLKLLPISGDKSLPKMNQGQFEELGDLVTGAI